MHKMTEATKRATDVFFEQEHNSCDEASHQLLAITVIMFNAVQTMFGRAGLVDFIDNALRELDRLTAENSQKLN